MNEVALARPDNEGMRWNRFRMIQAQSRETPHDDLTTLERICLGIENTKREKGKDAVLAAGGSTRMRQLMRLPWLAEIIDALNKFPVHRDDFKCGSYEVIKISRFRTVW